MPRPNPPTTDPEHQKVRLPPPPVPTAPRMAGLPWPCLDPQGAQRSVLVTGSAGPRPPPGIHALTQALHQRCPDSFCPSPHSCISVSKCPLFPPGCEVAGASAIWWQFSTPSEQSTEVQPLSELRGRAFIRSRAEALPSLLSFRQ